MVKRELVANCDQLLEVSRTSVRGAVSQGREPVARGKGAAGMVRKQAIF
jgi:hypothetical protein